VAVEVTVRGGGIFGLAIAWECARRGARVRLVEPRRIGAGASGGLVGALAPHAPEGWTPAKAFQLDSLLAAPAFWAGVAAAGGGDPGYARTGRLQPLPDAAAVARAEARAQAARGLWAGRAAFRVVPAPPGGWPAPPPTGLCAEDDLSARLHPRRALAALAAALAARGGEVVAEAPDRGAVIHATGWEGLEALSTAFGRPVGGGVKGQAMAVAAPQLGGLPQLYAGGLHIVPHADGTVAIGSTTERDFGDPSATDAGLDALLPRALAAAPALAGAPVVARWAGVRPRAVTRAAVLGPWPERPGHFLANGGFKTGFGLAPGVARALADLVLEGRDTIPEGLRVDEALSHAARRRP
jgi:glycine/D-amino acid oxidase-like deaminating enzyme